MIRRWKVCHLTTVHARHDTRICLKEARSLLRAGYSVALLVADGQGDNDDEGLRIYDVGRPKGRLRRIVGTTLHMLKKAEALDADIYHLHDPELLPVGVELKKRGKTVVFDSHEDIPMQVRGKSYLSKPLRALISTLIARYEAHACRRFDAVIAATPFIREKFTAINPNSIDVNNFPLLDESVQSQPDWSFKSNHVCYIGHITELRGVREMVRAMEAIKSDVRLQLGGKFFEGTIEREVQSYGGWGRVDALGWLGRDQVLGVLRRSVAGLVTLHPAINYLDALPVKMFEYMGAGIPVIASAFPAWREIIEKHDCGVCVDPLDPEAIAQAIDYISGHPERAQQMGENGRRAVWECYNWTSEAEKLFKCYSRLASA